MAKAFAEKLQELKGASRKHVFLNKNELKYIASKLQQSSTYACPVGSRGGRRGAASRAEEEAAAAQPPSIHLTSEYISTNFCLLGDGDNARVCRRLKSGGRVCVRPVVALEDLEGVLSEHHQALGHPGFEALYHHVSHREGYAEMRVSVSALVWWGWAALP